MTPVISRDNIVEYGFNPNSKRINGHMVYMMDDDFWHPYKKRNATFARRMDGPFTVLTAEGTVTCEDGYLAMDVRGYPYPIDAMDFELAYEPVNNQGEIHDSEESST